MKCYGIFGMIPSSDSGTYHVLERGRETSSKLERFFRRINNRRPLSNIQKIFWQIHLDHMLVFIVLTIDVWNGTFDREDYSLKISFAFEWILREFPSLVISYCLFFLDQRWKTMFRVMIESVAWVIAEEILTNKNIFPVTFFCILSADTHYFSQTSKRTEQRDFACRNSSSSSSILSGKMLST